MQVTTSETESRRPELYAALAPFPVRIDVDDLASLGSLDPQQLADLVRRAIKEASPEVVERVLDAIRQRRPELDYGNYALSITFWPGGVDVAFEDELVLLHVKREGPPS